MGLRRIISLYRDPPIWSQYCKLTVSRYSVRLVADENKKKHVQIVGGQPVGFPSHQESVQTIFSLKRDPLIGVPVRFGDLGETFKR